jgi:formate dehydrogenase major subunit
MLHVDGRATPAEGSLLDACRRVGADVPSFCHSERLSAGGHCRACLVEVNGHTVAACTAQARDGQTVLTQTPRLLAYRRDLGELMLCEAAPGGSVKQALDAWGVVGDRYSGRVREPQRDASHPYLRLSLDQCILCRQCVRACAEVQGQFVYAVAGRGAESRLTWGGGAFRETDCVACGACVDVCPTGAISDVDRLGAPPPFDSSVRTTCSYCGVGCQLDVRVRADDVAQIDAAPSPVNQAHLCVKGRYSHSVARHADRLTTPLIRKRGELVPASWPEAVDLIAREFGRLRGRLAALSSSRCTNEENYLVQKWFRAGLGTNDVDCCARVCHAPSAAGMRRSLGTGAATNSLADIERADLFLVAGSNTTTSHPVTGARVKQAVLRGARLIVVDPRRTELAALADVHLQLRPGSNVPLLNSLAAVLIEEGWIDQAFVAERTQGFEEYAEFVRRFPPEATASLTGVAPEDVRQAARLYAQAQRPMQLHGLGMTEHHQGSEGVMLLCNLALLVGAIGRAGVGVNPLRGQNNVQGAADMGCQPDLLTGYADPGDPSVRARFASSWGRPIPTAAGRTLPRMYEAMRTREIAGMYILGEDVVQTDPDSNQVVADLQALEFLVVQELFLTSTGRLAHVVLPGASFLEKDGTFTNGERRVQRVRRALAPPGQARPDWEILCQLMSATGYAQVYAGPAAIMAEIAQVAPPFAGVSYERLEGDGLQWPVPDAAHPGTSLLHAQHFPTGRASLTRVEYVPSPALLDVQGGLLLVTGRALEHYNNGSMTRRSANLELMPADLVSINPSDARQLDIRSGDILTLRSAFGEARGTADVTGEVAPGTLFMTFHFPESGTNRLTSNVRDRIADCPEYKLTPVKIVHVAAPSARADARGTPVWRTRNPMPFTQEPSA